MVPVRLCRAMEFEFSILPQPLKLRKVFSPEHSGDHPDRQEEIFPSVLPVVLIIQSAAEDNGMDMGMEVHSAAPGMQDADVTNISAKIFAVSCKLTQGTGCGVVKRRIQKFLVAVDNGV